MWHENVLGTIGNTPLVKLNKIAKGIPCTVLAKLELVNPGGSVKDRIGISMVRAAERDGRLKPGGTLIECTSGNTGAGLALAGIALGYRCIFTTTDKQSQEKVDVLRALGAEVHVCPTHVAPEDPRSYYSVAARLAKEIPNSVHLNQYDNPANTVAHYESTGPEIWRDTEGRVTHFFAGAGTGGTISGTTKYLKEKKSSLKTIGVDPYGSVYYKYFHTGEFDQKEIYPYLVEGVGEDILAGNMDFTLVDDFVRVTDRESMQMTRRLSKDEGMFVGQSCGMVAAGAIQWLEAHADELSAESVVVVLLPDSGFRYLSKTYNDNWMRGHGFLESQPSVTAASILKDRPTRRRVAFVNRRQSIGEVVATMAEYGISQVPVLEADDVVGTVTESGLLNHLIEHPTGISTPVGEIMGDPLPILSQDVKIEQLSEYLESKLGAVLVQQPDGTMEIITKSDVIGALARASDRS
jgi:cystathionine beta-synthase